MNIIRKQIKYVPTFVKMLTQVTRNCTQYPELPKTWIMPKKISSIEPERSGDGGLNLDVSKNDYMKYYEKSKELAEANDYIKKLFTLEFQPKKETVSVQRLKALELVQRHKSDKGSMESRIAAATIEILRLQEHHKNLPKDTRTKVFLKELIDKRKKWLKKLRLLDYPRFEFLLERLNLVYRPTVEKTRKRSIKGSIKHLHQKRSDQIIQKKLDAYKAELEAQQKIFFHKKVEQLQFIRNEEIACGVKPTVSEKDIKAAKKKAASFK